MPLPHRVESFALELGNSLKAISNSLFLRDLTNITYTGESKLGLPPLVTEQVKELIKVLHLEMGRREIQRYVLATQYQSLYEQTLKIGTRYLIEEIRILVLELQDKKMKIGEMEVNLSKYLNRNQIKYLLSKLLQDEVLVKDGKGKGTNYFITTKFDQYRGEILINQIITFLKDKYS